MAEFHQGNLGCLWRQSCIFFARGVCGDFVESVSVSQPRRAHLVGKSRWGSIIVFVFVFVFVSISAVSYDQALPFDEASMSVDALVTDSFADLGDSVMSNFDIISRSSTPAAPHGLPLLHGHPSPNVLEDLIAKPSSSSRIVPTSAPFTPSRNANSVYIPRDATPLAQVSVPTAPALLVATPRSGDTSKLHAKKDIKSFTTSSGVFKSGTTEAPSPLQHDNFPALGKGKEIPVGPRSMTPIKKPQALATFDDNAVAGTHINSKRPTPGILNIAAATIYTHKIPSLTEATQTPVKSVLAAAAFPALPPSTTSAQTPTTRPPKTLRIAPTAKSEFPSILTTATQSASFIATPHPSLTRQFSLVERSGTPVSEIISDNASITSNSLSRPSSPPPIRIGSAPVRSTTKSQQKKQRREAQKEKESHLGTVIDKPEPEIEIAPIMGRKKKQKKEKISNTTGGSTPAASRPQSPTSKEAAEVEEHKTNTVSEPSHSEVKSPVRETVMKSVDGKGKETKAKFELQTPPLDPPLSKVETTEELVDKPTSTPLTILQDLVSSGFVLDPKELAVFKAPVYPSYRLDVSGDMQEWDHKLIITEEDRQELLAGRPVHKSAQGLNRIMLTPNGDCVRNLTPEEEARYLELQNRILSYVGPAMFVSPRNSTTTGFSLVGGRAVPNGLPAFFLNIDDGKLPAMDPVIKVQREEALSYINQYVLPSLSTNVQLERALNATALNAEILRPNEAHNFGGYGAGDVRGEIHSAESLHKAASGILTTGLQNMTEHFARGRENERGQPLGSVTLLSLADAESSMNSARKETEKLEKSLNQLLKKNRRMMLGASH